MEHKFKNVPLPNFPGNWPEDYEHENGKYQNRCSDCGNLFFGHKRRPLCKICANKPIDWEEMAKKRPPTQHESWAWQGCWADGEMTGFARCMVKKAKPLEQSKAELIAALEQAIPTIHNLSVPGVSYVEYQEGLKTLEQTFESLLYKHKAQ